MGKQWFPGAKPQSDEVYTGPWRDDEEGPEYTEDNPPTVADYLRAARQAAREFRKLKP